MAGSPREIPADSGVQARQQGHEPRGLQVHLLVGVGPPLPRPHGRLRFRDPLRLLPGPRPPQRAPRMEARRHSRARRPAGRHRLVHGELGPRRSHRRQPLPSGPSPHGRLRDLRPAAMDGMEPVAARRAACGPPRGAALPAHGRFHRRADLPSARAGRTRRRLQGRTHAQHLATHGWAAHTRRPLADVALVFECLRERHDHTVQSPHDRLCHRRLGALARGVHDTRG